MENRKCRIADFKIGSDCVSKVLMAIGIEDAPIRSDMMFNILVPGKVKNQKSFQIEDHLGSTLLGYN